MGTRVRRRSRPTTAFLAAAALVVGLSASLVTAAAADLGGISTDDVFAWSAEVSIDPPTLLADDDFAATVCNEALDGTTDSLGNTWTVHAGDWRYQGCDEVRTVDRVLLAHATVSLPSSDDLSISTSLTRISSQADRSGPGISFLSDGSVYMYVIYERDQGHVTLGWVDSSGISALPGVPISDRATAEMSVVVDQPDITVTVDGLTVISYVMSGAQVTQYGGNTGFGLTADRDSVSRFDWFKVNTLP